MLVALLLGRNRLIVFGICTGQRLLSIVYLADHLPQMSVLFILDIGSILFRSKRLNHSLIVHVLARRNGDA